MNTITKYGNCPHCGRAFALSTTIEQDIEPVPEAATRETSPDDTSAEPERVCPGCGGAALTQPDPDGPIECAECGHTFLAWETALRERQTVTVALAGQDAS